ncbi:MAG: cold shock domain-containing protein [Bernardetiaceae bacterium]|nr:cold shock domain-containing protein [Bernardetiaceae bacterium]
MKTGKVKFFNEAKGYGFIVDDQTQKEVFVHISELSNATRLMQNDAVRYDVKMGKKGLNAVNVVKL